MPRYYGKTADRGYGTQHQALRRQRVKEWRPGDPCAHCGYPMLYRWLLTPDGRRVSALDLPHTDDRTGYLPGLAHRACNRRDGQRKTAAINRARGGMSPRMLAAVRVKQWQAMAQGSATRQW